jgi:hypothetical protein
MKREDLDRLEKIMSDLNAQLSDLCGSLRRTITYLEQARAEVDAGRIRQPPKPTGIVQHYTADGEPRKFGKWWRR